MSRIVDRGLGLRDLGSILATDGICTILHIQTRESAAILDSPARQESSAVSPELSRFSSSGTRGVGPTSRLLLFKCNTFHGIRETAAPKRNRTRFFVHRSPCSRAPYTVNRIPPPALLTSDSACHLVFPSPVRLGEFLPPNRPSFLRP